MHREEFIADNMMKVGYAVISADWRSADRSYFSDFRMYTHNAQWFACQIVSLLVLFINIISIHKVKPRNRDTVHGIIDSSNDAVKSTTPHLKPKIQGRPIDTDAPFCHFVNAYQISCVFRTCFHCTLKASNLDNQISEFIRLSLKTLLEESPLDMTGD